MKKSKSSTNYSNDHLPYDALVYIFMALNVADLAAVSLVCKSWKRASCDSTLWKKLDLTGMISSINFKIPMVRHACKDKHSSTKMTQFLKYALSLSNGNISCLVFNFYAYLRDVHLINAAKRTPNLKKLVLPPSGRLSKIGIHTAMRLWESLESITITSMVNHRYIFSAIGKYGLNITQIKFTCPFGPDHAKALVKYTPNLKLLSIRCSVLSMKALDNVINSLKYLEIVNICETFILDDRGELIVMYPIFDLQNHVSSSFLRKLLYCQKGSRCLWCKNKHNDPTRQPHRYLEAIWREDEIGSLAH